MNNQENRVCVFFSLCSYTDAIDLETLDRFIADAVSAAPVLSTRVTMPELIQGDWFGEKILTVELPSRSTALAWLESDPFRASFSELKRVCEVQLLLI